MNRSSSTNERELVLYTETYLISNKHRNSWVKHVDYRVSVEKDDFATYVSVYMTNDNDALIFMRLSIASRDKSLFSVYLSWNFRAIVLWILKIAFILDAYIHFPKRKREVWQASSNVSLIYDLIIYKIQHNFLDVIKLFDCVPFLRLTMTWGE